MTDTSFTSSGDEILHASPDGIAITDLDGRVRMASRAAVKMFGFEREDEMVGRPIGDFVAPEDRDRAAAGMAGMFEGVLTGPTEYRALRADGGTFDADVNSEFVRDADGLPTGMVFTVRDTTERRRLDEALRSSETRLRQLVESAHDFVWEIDGSGVYTMVSLQVTDILGYEPAELIGRTPFDLMPPEEAERVSEEFGGIVAERRPFRELRNLCRRKDGRLVILETNGAPFFDAAGALRGYRGTDRDITQRIEAEAAMQESEERYRLLAETSPDMIYVIDSDGCAAYVNGAAARALNADPEDIVGRPLEGLFEPQTAAQMGQAIEYVFDSAETLSHESSATYPGGVMWTKTTLVPMKDPDGRVTSVFGVSRDVTDRKREEEALQQSHDLLENLAQLVPGVVYQYRLYPDGRSAFPYSSPGMNDIYECTPEEVREDATPVFGRLHPDDYDRVSDAIAESARTLDTFYCEFRVILPRQGLRWRWSQAHPQRTEDGGTLWHGIISDITERKNAEEALRASEERLRSIIDATPIPLLIAEGERITYANPAFTATFGYAQQEIRTLADWWPRAYPDLEYRRRLIEAWASELERACQTGETFRPVEAKVRAKDGSEVVVLGGSAPMGDAAGDQQLLYLFDITARRRAEESYRTVLKTAMDGFVLSDAESRLLDANEAYCHMTGYTEAELLDMRISDLDVTDDECAVSVRSAEISERGSARFETKHRRKDGSLFDVEASVQYDPQAGTLASFLRDITDRKRAAAELKQLNASLEDRVQERTRELDETVELLTEANEAKAKFLRSMSHELRTPLNSVIGFSSMLADGIPGRVNEEQRRQLVMIKNSGQHLLALINDILDLSKIEAGVVDLHFEPIDIARLATNVASECRPSAESKGLSLVVESCEPELMATSDIRAVRQILLNLVGNAIKFTEAGGVVLRCSATTAGGTAISVTDTGPGIAPEQEDRIFVEFGRGAEPNRSTEGTGLGLAISLELAIVLGGGLEVETEVGVGSTFTLTLPVSQGGGSI